MYDDTAAAVRSGRAPEYPVAESLVDVRIRLALLESTRRGGSWVEWGNDEALPVVSAEG